MSVADMPVSSPLSAHVPTTFNGLVHDQVSACPLTAMRRRKAQERVDAQSDSEKGLWGQGGQESPRSQHILVHQGWGSKAFFAIIRRSEDSAPLAIGGLEGIRTRSPG